MNPSFETLIYATSDDGVATLTLNRPDVLNSLNSALMSDLLAAIEQAVADPDVRALLITGAGKGFCAGADLGDVNLDRTEEAGRQREARTHQTMKEYLNPIVSRLMGTDKPVVCAVNGVAAGGGMGLALSADIVVAAESASFVQVFIPQLGIIPDMGSTWLLPRLVGRARFLGLALSGDKLKARDAEQWGLIWRCTADDQLMAEANAIAGKLAQTSASGIAAFKKAVQASEHNDFDQQLALEGDLQGKCCGSNDFAEGSEAFLQKRKPVFNK